MVNGKIYIGCHQTFNLNDGYMGSGRRLKYAISKYGIASFEKTILQMFQTADEMFAAERDTVNEEFLNRDDVYNLQLGGGGGLSAWHEENSYEFHRSGYDAMIKIKDHVAASKKAHRTRKLNPSKYKEEMVHSTTNARKQALSENSRAKRIDTFQQIEHARGTKNSQYGTRWITDDVINAKIANNLPIPSGWRPGRVLRR